MRDRHGRAKLAVLAELAVAGLPGATLPVLTLAHAAPLALPLTSIKTFYAANWIGTVLAVLPMAVPAARLVPRRAFLSALVTLAVLGPATTLPLELVPLLSLHVM